MLPDYSSGIERARVLIEQNLSPHDEGLEQFLNYLELREAIAKNPTHDLNVAVEAIEMVLCLTFCQKEERYAQLHNLVNITIGAHSPNAKV